MVDPDGRDLILGPRPADDKDRDGAGPRPRSPRHLFRFGREAFSDSGIAGGRPATATIIIVEDVRRPPNKQPPLSTRSSGWSSALPPASAETEVSGWTGARHEARIRP
jgi:hypothetical protein